MSKFPVLFDVNGRFGNSCYALPDYPQAKDLLASMDRLGIGRSLVWNVESRDSNCVWSNRRMLSEIQNTPGAEGRLIPSFTVSPTMIYEKGAVEELKQVLGQTGSSALRFTRGLTNFTLAQIEPIVREIQGCNPVIVLSNNDAGADDILAFTEKFPGIHLILTEVSWSRYAFVFDLMRRRKNILAETSWLHTWEAIEMIIDHFGSERIVFGMGGKASNGASIAALAQSRISDRDRELIAHGNLERLLNLKPVDSGDFKGTEAERKPMWSRMIQGQSLGEDLIDAHGHLGPSGGYVVEHQRAEDQIAPALRKMDELGIRTMIFSGMQALFSDPVRGNFDLENLLKPYGDRFKGYAVFNPIYEKFLVENFDAFFAGDFFVGFKTLCDYWKIPITDPRFEKMWQYADDHRLPVLNHTWEGTFNSPALFKEIVKKYPNASFLIAHAGGGDRGRKEAVELAMENDNVYLEWCGSFCSAIPWEETLALVGNRKVVFGTDGVDHDLAWELGRLISVNVSEETIRPILAENMRKILAMRR